MVGWVGRDPVPAQESRGCGLSAHNLRLLWEAGRLLGMPGLLPHLLALFCGCAGSTPRLNPLCEFLGFQKRLSPPGAPSCQVPRRNKNGVGLGRMDLKSQCFLKHNPAHQPAKPWMSNRQATQTSLAGDARASPPGSLCVPVLVVNNRGRARGRDGPVQFLTPLSDLRVHFLLRKVEETAATSRHSRVASERCG